MKQQCKEVMFDFCLNMKKRTAKKIKNLRILRREQDFLISTLCNEGKRGKKALAQKKAIKINTIFPLYRKITKEITEHASKGLYA